MVSKKQGIRTDTCVCRSIAGKSSLHGSRGAACGPLPPITTLPYAGPAGGTPDPPPVTEGDPWQLCKRSAEQHVLICFCCPGNRDHPSHTHTHTHRATETTLCRQELNCKEAISSEILVLSGPLTTPRPEVPSAASMGCSFLNRGQLLEMDAHSSALGMCWGEKRGIKACRREGPPKRYLLLPDP